MHLRQKSVLSGQHISLGLFSSILVKAVSLPHSSILVCWSPFEALHIFFPSHPTYLKLFVFGNITMLQVWPRVLLRCWILKNLLGGSGWLTREGAKVWGQKHSTVVIPAQAELCQRLASLSSAGKTTLHVKMLRLSYHSNNTWMTESHFQPPPLLLVLLGFLWKVFRQIRGNPWFWQLYSRVASSTAWLPFAKG